MFMRSLLVILVIRSPQGKALPNQILHGILYVSPSKWNPDVSIFCYLRHQVYDESSLLHIRLIASNLMFCSLDLSCSWPHHRRLRSLYPNLQHAIYSTACMSVRVNKPASRPYTTPIQSSVISTKRQYQIWMWWQVAMTAVRLAQL